MPRDEMPILGRPPRRGRFWKIALAGVGGLGLCAGLWLSRGRDPEPAGSAGGPSAAASAVLAAADGGSPLAASTGEPGATPSATGGAPGTGATLAGGLRRLSLQIDGPLESAIVRQVGKDLGRPLVQVVVRALVWWIDVPNGLRKGDKLELLFQPREGGEPLVHALRFQSGKTGQTHLAYRYRPQGGASPGASGRFYAPSGEELELRLENGPLDDYEQVTSLLRDGRGHQGVDFRTPVGTPVKAPFDGTVLRKTWNFKMNGSSIELVEDAEPHRHAVFLHLSEIAAEVIPGVKVQRGQVVAQSGNTGHSFAPHLHYELHAADGAVLDPFRAHATRRATLPEGERPPFQAEVRRLEAMLTGEPALVPPAPAADPPPAAPPTHDGGR